MAMLSHVILIVERLFKILFSIRIFTNMTDPKSIPNASVVAQASELDILDVKGNKVKFGSIFETEKAIIVFIRSYTS